MGIFANNMSQLIAYFGGSFDPVHQGHLATAKFLVDYFQLHKLFFLPAYLSPLKSQSLAAHHRVAMLKLAIEGQAHFSIDEQELLQPSKSYTINTLKNLRQQYGQTQPLAFVMGMDSFLSLPQWYLWQQLTDFAHLIIVNRPHYAPVFSTELQQWLNKHRSHQRQLLEYQAAGLVYFVNSPLYAISSTQIRKALQQGQLLSQYLNPAVVHYIYHHHLYGATATHES